MSHISKKDRFSHDHFFKKSMSNPKVAKEFFETHLPSFVRSKVDLNTLKPEKDSFLDNTLGEGIVDMLFSVHFGDSIGYFYILVEHQSNPSYWMPFRLHKYMLRICDNHLKKYPETKHLPLIYPLVFYTGLKKYDAPLDLCSLHHDPELARLFYTSPFQLIELQNIEDREIRKKVWLGVMEYVMKRIYEQDILPFLETIKPLLAEIAQQDLGYIEIILWYTVEKAESHKVEEVIEIFKEVVPTEERGKIMTIAERLIEKGKVEGIQEGIQKGKVEGIQEGIQKGVQEGIELSAINMLKNGIDFSLVVKVTGLPMSEVQRLAASVSAQDSKKDKKDSH